MDVCLVRPMVTSGRSPAALSGNDGHCKSSKPGILAREERKSGMEHRPKHRRRRTTERATVGAEACQHGAQKAPEVLRGRARTGEAFPREPAVCFRTFSKTCEDGNVRKRVKTCENVRKRKRSRKHAMPMARREREGRRGQRSRGSGPTARRPGGTAGRSTSARRPCLGGDSRRREDSRGEKDFRGEMIPEERRKQSEERAKQSEETIRGVEMGGRGRGRAFRVGCERAGTSPVNAVVRGTSVERQRYFQSSD